MNKQEENICNCKKDGCDCNIIHKEAVKIAEEKMPDEEIFDNLINFYKLIADSTRAKILFALDQHEMCVCDIAATLGMTKSAVSHQLKLLKDNNLVKSRKDGKEVFYKLSDEHVTKVFEISLEHIKEL